MCCTTGEKAHGPMLGTPGGDLAEVMQVAMSIMKLARVVARACGGARACVRVFLGGGRWMEGGLMCLCEAVIPSCCWRAVTALSPFLCACVGDSAYVRIL